MKQPIENSLPIYDIHYKSVKSRDEYFKFDALQRPFLEQVAPHLLNATLKNLLQFKNFHERDILRYQEMINTPILDPSGNTKEFYLDKIKSTQDNLLQFIETYVKRVNEYDKAIRLKIQLAQEQKELLSLALKDSDTDMRTMEGYNITYPIYAVLYMIENELKQKGWVASFSIEWVKPTPTHQYLLLTCDFR
jgi:hypothetical protein